MNQCDATLLIAETLFVRTVNRRWPDIPGRERGHVNRTYFRVYIPPIQEFITGRFCARGDLPDAEPPRRPAYQPLRSQTPG